jgi:hypothetical protein
VHGGLGRHKIEEVIALRLRPRLDCECQIELNDDSGQKLVVSGSGVASRKGKCSFCDFASTTFGVYSHRILAGLYTVFQAINFAISNHCFPPVLEYFALFFLAGPSNIAAKNAKLGFIFLAHFEIIALPNIVPHIVDRMYRNWSHGYKIESAFAFVVVSAFG